MNSTLRGKHPEVESATKFLQRLREGRRQAWEAAEFGKLVAKGKRPRDDTWKAKFVEPAPAETTDLPDLPADWCWASIEELCPLDGPAVYGIIQPGDHVDGGVPYIRPLDMSDEGTVELSQLKRTTHEIADDYERSKLRTGDVVLSIVGTIGKVLQVTQELEGANITQSSIRIRPPDGMPPGYVKLMLQSPVLRGQFDRYRFGNAVQRLNVEHVRRLAVPLAPLDVQRRIVKKLDELLAQSRAAREQLEAVPALVETFRQSVLAAAFRGDLTADWRKKNPNVEPASKLLERIRVERRKKWEEGELAKMKARGKEAKDDKWKEKYEEPEPVDATDLPVLPETWAWATVEELCPHDAPAVYGIIQPGPHVERGVPYIRPLDVDAAGLVRLQELNRTTRQIADDCERSVLDTGDVVLSIVGTIGKVLVVSPELKGANITQSSIRIRPPKGMPTEYLQRLLQSPVMRRQYDRHRFGNAVQRLNVEHVRRLVVPLAPEEEARALVKLLEPRLQQARAVAAAAEAVDVAQLERCLLAKAFRGELDLDGTDAEVVSLQQTAQAGAEQERGEERTA